MEGNASLARKEASGRNSRYRRVGLMAAGLMIGALFIGGCSDDSESPRVADVGNSSSNGTGNAPSAPSSARADALAYSKCMRSHGISNFPDPNAQGQIWLGDGGKPQAGLDPSSQQFKAAEQACRSLAPGGTPEQVNRDRAGALKYSKCMRSHGVPKFPDPDAQGGLKVNVNEVDSSSPQFKAAEKACADLQPGGPGAVRRSFGPGGGGS